MRATLGVKRFLKIGYCYFKNNMIKHEQQIKDYVGE